MQIKKFINSNSLTLLVAIVGVLLSMWIWRSDLHSKSLNLRLVSQVALQPDSANAISGLQVSIDGVSLKTPYLSVLELTNDGERPIVVSDYETPLEFRIQKGSILNRALVTTTSPRDLEVTLTWNPQAVILKPILLNPRDTVTISALTSESRPIFTTRARIAGISSVPLDLIANKPTTWQSTLLLLFAALLLAVASDITNTGFPSNKKVFLRRRSALLVSIATGTTAAVIFYKFLDAVNMQGVWEIILSYVGLLLVSGVVSVYWNGGLFNSKNSMNDEDEDPPIEPPISAASLRAGLIKKKELNGLAMKRADLTRAPFEYFELENADFEGSDLSGASFQGCTLSNASFVNAKLGRTSFYAADLRGVNFSGATLLNARMQKARLEGANLETAVLDGVDLRATYDKNTKWPAGFDPLQEGAVYIES